MEKILKNLTECGLSKNEAAVYYASLTLGPTSVLQISKHSGVTRATTYTVIDSLMQKGLMRAEERGLKTVFIAENPEYLTQVMERKMDKLGEIIPDLTILHKKLGKQSMIRSYEGLPAALNIYTEIRDETRTNESLFFIGGSLGFSEINAKEQQKHFTWKSRMTLDIRLIFQDSKRADMHKSLSKALKQKVKVFPKVMTIDSDIIITSRKVVIMRISHPTTTLVIEDADIIKTYRELFLYIWSTIPDGEK